ncbi:MAG: 16S rRNA (adenine(1518)-N(6)/adenine(1519)-N(6))-dimethyltransferase RsmA [Gammaproteobacteria bacterium]|nr:16S rRNA (adenine(1518)-N(6)/adenine(1519)-N(6))-dimethyltransferase RsmA [Gammaproteobacteria bacterium]
MATGFRARKRFGQNFLHDQGVIQSIIGALAPRDDEVVVEIGPGLGALTEPLLARSGRLIAVELDRDLAADLRQRFGDQGLTLVEADALTVDFASMKQPGRGLRLIGNLPYNISTPLLFHLFTQLDAIDEMLFMLQLEVVERMVADPGRRTYGRLSVMVQYHCGVEQVMRVAPDSFRPAPKVESAVVRLRPLRDHKIKVRDESCFAEVVRRAFAQRRKMLRKLFPELSAADWTGLDIDPTARPETISVAGFAALSDFLAAPADVR